MYTQNPNLPKVLMEEYYLKNGPGTYVLTLVLPDVATSVAKSVAKK